jgi:hypothetical protein
MGGQRSSIWNLDLMKICGAENLFLDEVQKPSEQVNCSYEGRITKRALVGVQ